MLIIITISVVGLIAPGSIYPNKLHIYNITVISQKMLSEKFQSIQNSNHWDQQIVLLQSLEISEQTALALNCPKNTTIIKNLLLNPRSKVITSTCIFLITMCEKYGPMMNNFIGNLLGTDILFKLLCSSNRVIFMEIHELFKAVVMHCPQVKYYKIFASEMNSKNCQVRECISSYLLVLSDNIQAPGNYIPFVRSWKNDPSKIVRDNAAKIEQIINKQLLSSQKIAAKNNKENRPIVHQQHQIKKQKSSIIENSQIIIESFLNNSHTSYSNSNIQIDLDENIEFLISKIYSDQSWNMKMFAIEEIYQIFQSNELEEKNFMKLVSVFIDFLDEKRGKLNVIMCGILKKCVTENSQMMKKFLTNNFQLFVQKSGKNQQYGRELIDLAVNLDPHKYIMQLAQCTVDIKILKEKVLILDLLATKISQIQISQQKIPIFIKLISKHIQKYSSNKEIYLPCLAILSHFKVQHPAQFLSSILCQDKLILNKVIELSQRIDPHLREAIINYIHELKGPSEKYETKQKLQISQSQSYLLNSQLEELLIQVYNNEENVTKLVQFVFEGKNNISVRQFYEIIKLTEKVTSKDSLLELELLLEEICKTQNQNFLEALFQAIVSCNGNSIQSEYILAYLRKIHSKFINFSWLMQPRHAQKLITIYRYSKCPKIRLSCIKILSLFPTELTAAYINPKQKKLIKTQQKIQNQTP